ncbi:hypothetical protein NDU88_007469 [Pleurodeles waltl]|uniref:Uncharacterized protein n=1 Tax=Pleurodeles waltl TaxID=8319 RepID=A0AAV7U1J5_PLEWA|nr:hypothetical protein NDU88_007469 [Pleurodeles waltl]
MGRKHTPSPSLKAGSLSFRPRGGAEHQCSPARQPRPSAPALRLPRGLRAVEPADVAPRAHQQWSPQRCLEAGGPTTCRGTREGSGRTSPPTVGAPQLQAAPVPIQEGWRQAQHRPHESPVSHFVCRGITCTPGLRRSLPPPRVRGKPLLTPVGSPSRINVRESLLPSGASHSGCHS